jgi:uncharacterized protein YqgV (UPF0045/DUF77 family)
MSEKKIRIAENIMLPNGDFVDGQILTASDLNRISKLLLAGINNNFDDIQKLIAGNRTLYFYDDLASLQAYANANLDATDDGAYGVVVTYEAVAGVDGEDEAIVKTLAFYRFDWNEDGVPPSGTFTLIQDNLSFLSFWEQLEEINDLYTNINEAFEEGLDEFLINIEDELNDHTKQDNIIVVDRVATQERLGHVKLANNLTTDPANIDGLALAATQGKVLNDTKVTGPTTPVVSNNFVVFDGTTGKLVKDASINSSSFAAANHEHTFEQVKTTIEGVATNLTTVLAKKADLGADNKIPASQLPSFVDDVIEVADETALNTLPTEEKVSGKIYVTLNDNKSWRWGSSTFVEVSPSIGTNLAQGTNTTTGVVITSSTGNAATLNGATDTLAGIMTAADKIKLDGLTNYSHPTQTAIDVDTIDATMNVIEKITVDTLGHVTAVGTKTLATATITTDGILSAADKLKLEGLLGPQTTFPIDTNTFDGHLITIGGLKQVLALPDSLWDGISYGTAYKNAQAQVAITRGQAVQFVSNQGDHILVKPAVQSEVNAFPSLLLGVAPADIPQGSLGVVLNFGQINNINTSSIPGTGPVVYFNSAGTTPGTLTRTKPVAPFAKIEVLAIIKESSGNSGIVQVRIGNSSVLGGTDANVEFGTLANNDLIAYNTATQRWENIQPGTLGFATLTQGVLPVTQGGTGIGVLTGLAGKYLRVKADLSGYEFVTVEGGGGGGGVLNFIDGGAPDSVYLETDLIDGGAPDSIYG